MRLTLSLLIFVLSFGLISEEEVHLAMMEVCDNALDDDGDGLIDLNDEDCECNREAPTSLIPNPSFEEQNCCPQGRSQLNCATDWDQASQPTTDYIHSCGFLGWDGIPAPVPYPDGEGVVGFRDGRNIMGNKESNWKEYAGACLIEPLRQGVEYNFQFFVGFVDFAISPPINITFFGTPDCDNLPFGQEDEFLGCPTNDPDGGWQLLSDKRVEGRGWVQTTISIIPDEDIAAIAIGPPCAQTSSQENLYYFFDNLLLAESKFFSKTIIESENPCTDNYILSVTTHPDATYQWYKDGIAIVGETTSLYKPNLVEGDYAVLETLDGECNLSTTNSYRVPQEVTAVDKVICDEEVFFLGGEELTESGEYVDTLQTESNCDSIILLDLEVLGSNSDTLSARIFDGDSYEVGSFSFSEGGDYDITLQSQQGCDSLIFLDLDLYKVYIPNVFSPNDDGVNDFFEIFVEEVDINVNSINIYDRWGTRVFRRNSNSGDGVLFWDGSHEGNAVAEGVYTYVVEFDIEDGSKKIQAGEVTILD